MTTLKGLIVCIDVVISYNLYGSSPGEIHKNESVLNQMAEMHKTSVRGENGSLHPCATFACILMRIECH